MTSPARELATFTVRAEIGTITLCRAERRNALSLELLETLRGRLAEASASGLRALILKGDGPTFCAGMDLRGVIGDEQAAERILVSLAHATLALRALPFPTIASVQGAAIGGGCGLMVVCDFAFTHATAKIGYPEVDLGVCPAVVAPWLIQKIGAGAARAMLLRGGTISGEESHRRGLSTHLSSEADLDRDAEALAIALAAAGPGALAATKHWLNKLDGSLDQEAVLEGARLSARVVSSPEAQSRLRAAMGTNNG